MDITIVDEKEMDAFRKMSASKVITRKEELKGEIQHLFLRSTVEVAEKVYEYFVLSRSEDDDYSLKDCADELGISIPSITRLLAWQYTPKRLRGMVESGKLSFYQATMTVMACTQEQLYPAIDFIVGEGLTVTQTRLYLMGKKKKEKRKATISPIIRRIDLLLEDIRTLKDIENPLRTTIKRKLWYLKKKIEEQMKKVR